MSFFRRLVPSDYGPVVLTIIATAALAVSSGTLVDLMDRLNWDMWMAVLQPVSIDVCAGYAVWLWLTSKRPDTVSLARVVALVCLGVSILGNGLEHVVAALNFTLPAWAIAVLAAVFGAIPPVAFFVGVHLRATARGQQTKRRAKAPVEEQPVEEPKPQPKEEPKRPLRSVPAGDDAARVGEILAELAAQGAQVSRAKVQGLLRERYGAGMNNARLQELLNAAKAA